MECKGERSNTCGGVNRLSIYRLELAQESARRCKSSPSMRLPARPRNGEPLRELVVSQRWVSQVVARESGSGLGLGGVWILQTVGIPLRPSAGTGRSGEP